MDAKKYIDYWHELRTGISIPNRVNFNPMCLKKLLPFMLVLESSQSGTLQKRLSGSFIDSFLASYNVNNANIINLPLELNQLSAWRDLLTSLLRNKRAGVTFEATVMANGTFFDTVSGAFLPFWSETKNLQLIGGIWPSQNNIKGYTEMPTGSFSFVETRISIIASPDQINRNDVKPETFKYFKMRDDLIALAS